MTNNLESYFTNIMELWGANDSWWYFHVNDLYREHGRKAAIAWMEEWAEDSVTELQLEFPWREMLEKAVAHINWGSVLDCVLEK